MTAFALLVKSYAPDLPYVERLMATVRLHNVESVPVHVVVPQADKSAAAAITAAKGILILVMASIP